MTHRTKSKKLILLLVYFVLKYAEKDACQKNLTNSTKLPGL